MTDSGKVKIKIDRDDFDMMSYENLAGVLGKPHHNVTINVTDVDERVFVGTVTTIAGNGSFGFDNGPGLNSAFSVMTGIEVTVTGQILVADRRNNVIRHIDNDLNVTTYAGSGVEGDHFLHMVYAQRDGVEGWFCGLCSSLFANPIEMGLGAEN